MKKKKIGFHEQVGKIKNLFEAKHGIIRPLVNEQEQQFITPQTTTAVELSDDGSVVSFKPKSNNQLHFLYCNDMMGFKQKQIESNITNEVVLPTDIGLSNEDVETIFKWCSKSLQG